MVVIAQEYFYPYCGLRKGWCTNKEKCKVLRFNDGCKFFALRHPVTGLYAVMMNEDTKAWLKEIVKGDTNIE